MKLNLTQDYIDALDELAKHHDMKVESIVKQAIRLYQLIDHEARLGRTMKFVNQYGELIRDPVWGCGGDD